MRIGNNIKLAEYTTFHIGGPAKFFVQANSVEDVKEAVNFVKKNKLKIFILGGGSNVLLSDQGITGLVLRMNIKGLEFKGSLVSIGAGDKWDRVVAKTVAKELGGIENLSLIPGTVGGAVYQNIGAYGAELKDVLYSVEVLDINSGLIKNLSNKECGFAYRHSIFQTPKGRSLIIIKANLKLSKNYKPNLKYPDLAKYFATLERSERSGGRMTKTLQEIRKAVIKIRKSKLVYPNAYIGTAGSFFKNPVINAKRFDKIIQYHPDIKGRETSEGRGQIKLFAGQLVEKSGWKGIRLGDVGVSEKHAMVLVSYKGGKADDIINLSHSIISSVKDNFGITLEPEVKIMA